jgi:hypothetical protein
MIFPFMPGFILFLLALTSALQADHGYKMDSPAIRGLMSPVYAVYHWSVRIRVSPPTRISGHNFYMLYKGNLEIIVEQVCGTRATLIHHERLGF